MGPHLPGASSRQEGEAGDILKGIAVGERWEWGSSSLSSLAVVLLASTGEVPLSPAHGGGGCPKVRVWASCQIPRFCQEALLFRL